MTVTVLYEDNHLIAVYKPAGVLVQAGDTPGHDDETLYWQVKMFLKERDKKPGNVFLGVLHRLDRNVSGIILFAKTSKGAARLSEQIRERTVKKIYHAVVIGVPDLSEAELKNFIEKTVGFKSVVHLLDSLLRIGDEATLKYKVLKTNKVNSLLRIELETGRFHQIRAQLSAIGHPILGDLKYGAPEGLPNNVLALCATELHFKTATTDEEVSVSIEIPSEWATFLEE